MIKSSCFSFLLAVLPLVGTSRADETHSPNISVLLPPHQLTLYEKPHSEISERQQWRMRIHGLRHAMLHPLIWGTRKAEATENRRIIPLKLFVLRSSEDPSYSLRSFRMVFSFKDASPDLLENQPRDFDPLLEVGFKGEYIRGAPSARPLLDRSYVIRLSAIPALHSGLYYRSLSSYLHLQTAEVAKILPGKRYEMILELTPLGCELKLDGKKILSYLKAGLDKGFVTLRSSWHPATVEVLEIKGEKHTPSGVKAVVESGLVPPFPEALQRIEPALKDLPIS